VIRIRDARISDVAWLLEELRSFDRFFGTRKSLVPASDADAMEIIGHLVDTQPFFIAESAESGDHHGPEAFQRAGLIAGALAPHLYNPAVMVLTELFWWVSPDRRGTSAGARLLSHFIAYGRAHADLVVMSVLENSQLSAGALESRGFHLHERSYLMEVAK
jgi:N-acetylglutamate synthase-like GNAT family acetyltransferase